jgi:hypothetical protein
VIFSPAACLQPNFSRRQLLETSTPQNCHAHMGAVSAREKFSGPCMAVPTMRVNKQARNGQNQPRDCLKVGRSSSYSRYVADAPATYSKHKPKPFSTKSCILRRHTRLKMAFLVTYRYNVRVCRPSTEMFEPIKLQ